MGSRACSVRGEPRSEVTSPGLSVRSPIPTLDNYRPELALFSESIAKAVMKPPTTQKKRLRADLYSGPFGLGSRTGVPAAVCLLPRSTRCPARVSPIATTACPNISAF
jgi:hypothetical protein